MNCSDFDRPRKVELDPHALLLFIRDEVGVELSVEGICAVVADMERRGGIALGTLQINEFQVA